MKTCHPQLSSCFQSTPDPSGCAGTWAHPGTTSESPVTQGLVHSKSYQVFLWKDNRTEGRVRRGGGTANSCPALGALDASWAAAGHVPVPNVTSSCELTPWLLLTLQEPPYHFLLPKTAEAPRWVYETPLSGSCTWQNRRFRVVAFVPVSPPPTQVTSLHHQTEAHRKPQEMLAEGINGWIWVCVSVCSLIPSTNPYCAFTLCQGLGVCVLDK